MALMAAVEGDVEEAREQYPFHDTIHRTFQRLPDGQTTRRLLGVVAHGAGMPEQAAAHYEDGIAFCRSAGYRPELDWTCCDCDDGGL